MINKCKDGCAGSCRDSRVGIIPPDPPDAKTRKRKIEVPEIKKGAHVENCSWCKDVIRGN